MRTDESGAPTPRVEDTATILVAELRTEINLLWKLLWLVAKRKGGRLTFSPKELQSMKSGGRIQRTTGKITGTIVVRAL